MKICKLSVSLFFSITLLCNLAFAACPKDDEGAVNYEKIPVIVKDKIGDVSGFPVFYWNEENLDWSEVDNSSEYIYNQNSALDIKSVGLCLDDGERNDGLGLFMRISMAGFPGAYKSLSNNKHYLTGTGPLADEAVNPVGFSGSMVFKIADSSKLSQGTPVYFMVASFDRIEGEPTLSEENQNPGPPLFWLLKSKEEISSKEEFEAFEFSADNTEFVADLDESDHQSPGNGEGGEGEGPGGGPEEGDEQFLEEVPAYIQVEARVQALTEHAGIGKNTNVLVAVTMTTERPDESGPEGSAFDSASTGISDSSPIAKGKLSKFKPEKQKGKKKGKK